MPDLINTTLTHLHPVMIHFPIVLLIASVALDLYGRWQPAVRQTAWITLLLGTIAAIPAVITGIIAHFPYEGTAVIESIERHEQLGLLTIAGMTGGNLVYNLGVGVNAIAR